MSDWYKLDDKHNVIGPVDARESANHRKSGDWIVAKTQVGDCEVSTVFLGLDHRYDYTKGKPLVFETLIFGGPFADAQERYETWAEAEAGHARYVDMCQPIMTEDVR